jgi:hypothetical protein
MKSAQLLGALAVALLATAAAAQPAPPPGFGPPPYQKQPSQAELAAVFPAEAAQKGIDGLAALQCKVAGDGALQDCKVLRETPPGFGFGQALLSLASKYRLPPKFPAPGGVFTLQQRFQSPKSRFSERLLIGKPVWAAAPSTGDVAKAYASLPAGAAPGSLVFRCDDDGRALKDCDLIKGPASPAYEAAGRPLLEKFRLAGKRDFKANPYVYVAITLDPPAKPEDAGYLLEPEWVQGPTAEQTRDAFPKAAGAVQAGQAGVDCRLDASGHLTDCHVVAEDPKDKGFGAAALSLASLMAVNPWTEDGHSVEGVRVQFALGFRQGPPGPAPGKTK